MRALTERRARRNDPQIPQIHTDTNGPLRRLRRRSSKAGRGPEMSWQPNMKLISGPRPTFARPKAAAGRCRLVSASPERSV